MRRLTAGASRRERCTADRNKSRCQPIAAERSEDNLSDTLFANNLRTWRARLSFYFSTSTNSRAQMLGKAKN